ncbi:MAG: hypothetical protein AMJ78_06660 [Omnitrophica WOR_2 bacterium SM23_29]|nr:MAG: hypothetical protein AMJ78_06660 [Omnitrophica WOR_2 bacterium SM23_29]
MPRTFNIKNLRGGFTLIELILVTILISILLGAITATYVVGLRAWDVGILHGGIKKEASYSLRIMSEELRQATSITSANQNDVTFVADLDGNGIDDTITYSWSGVVGENLNKVQSATTISLAKDVESAQFQYYDANNNLLSPPVTASSVRVVEITLRLKKEDESIRYIAKFRSRGI